MRQYIYIINRGIAFLAVCLSFIGCGNADIGTIESLTERPAFVLHQTLPEELCGTWYDVQGWENYETAGQYNISKEGILVGNWRDYFIDYNNQAILFDYAAYNWNRYCIGEILYFKDGLFVFIKEDSNGKIYPTVLSKDPNATLGSLESLHELSGIWICGTTFLTIDADGTVISYNYSSHYTQEANSISFNGHLFLSKDIESIYSSANVIHISYENTGNELKVGEKTYTKLQDVPENFCGKWYRMNDWYNSSDIGDLFNITHIGMCFKSDASVLGLVNYSANTLFLRYKSSFSIDYMSEDYLILSESQYGNTAIYNRDPQNATISVEAADPALFGTWASEISPTRYITINEDGTIKNNDGQTGRYFNYKGTLYSTVNSIPYNNSKKHTYQITDNELLLGDIKFKKATVTE